MKRPWTVLALGTSALLGLPVLVAFMLGLATPSEHQLRLAVKTSGCSGLAYAIEFADALQPEDIQFASHGVTLLVDPKSLPFLDGTELDFVREGLNEGFKFNNPNVKSACGCGESFGV